MNRREFIRLCALAAIVGPSVAQKATNSFVNGGIVPDDLWNESGRSFLVNSWCGTIPYSQVIYLGIGVDRTP